MEAVIDEPTWSVHQFAERSYYFFWRFGFHYTAFSVTGDGVIALDPISAEAAAVYKQAVASVTDEPIRYVVYSHDHLDHITGADVLAPEATIVSHNDVPERLISRGHTHIPLPHVLVDTQHRLSLGDVTWDLLYLGPNHGRCNLAVHNRAERWAFLVDVVTAGYMPYRYLPFAEFPAFMTTLDRLSELDADLISDGHCEPSSIEWVDRYREYFGELLEATREARATLDERAVLAELPPGSDGVVMTEEMIRRTGEVAVDRLRPKYGDWAGFERWAPLNADRMVLYLITGE